MPAPAPAPITAPPPAAAAAATSITSPVANRTFSSPILPLVLSEPPFATGIGPLTGLLLLPLTLLLGGKPPPLPLKMAVDDDDDDGDDDIAEEDGISSLVEFKTPLLLLICSLPSFNPLSLSSFVVCVSPSPCGPNPGPSPGEGM